MKPRISDYRTVDSGYTVGDVFDETNLLVYRAHGPDVREREGAIGVMVDPPFQYKRLLSALAGTAHVNCLPFRELLVEPCPRSELRCAIRHDVDVDIRAALNQAEMEYEHGIRTTYFILHTAPYYGYFNKGIFHRHECMAYVYKAIQDFGHEIALHTDGLLVYQQHKIDGAEAIRSEIEWLRTNGIDIVGTTAHNSASVYGAENYAIFKGRQRPLSDAVSVTDKKDDSKVLSKEVVHNGNWAPLEVLNERELGLEYESNDVFWQKHTKVHYGALRAVNAWRWNSHLVDRKCHTPPRESWFYDQDRLIDDIEKLSPGGYLVLVVHPVYYGARPHEASAPPLRMDVREVCTNLEIGWETYRPGALQARSGLVGGVQEFQSLNVANEWGMLDFPLIRPSSSQERRVAILGGTNIDGSSLSIPSHIQSLLPDLLAPFWETGAVCRKCAFPGMGVTRLYGWLEKLRDEFQPEFVILGVGADAIHTCLPSFWTKDTGFCRTFPPGVCLECVEGQVAVVQASPGAEIRRKDFVLCEEERPSLATSEEHWLEQVSLPAFRADLFLHLEFVVAAIREAGSVPLLLIEECGESLGIWDRDIDIDVKRAAQTRTHTFFADLSDRLGVELVDPYESFLETTLPTHWTDVREWNHTGHRIAAHVLRDCLVENA